MLALGFHGMPPFITRIRATLLLDNRLHFVRFFLDQFTVVLLSISM